MGISNNLIEQGVLKMKKIAKLSFFYCILGLLLGVFYREYTKINGFTEHTVLSGLHTHVLVLGTFFFLILLLLEKFFALTTKILCKQEQRKCINFPDVNIPIIT